MCNLADLIHVILHDHTAIASLNALMGHVFLLAAPVSALNAKPQYESMPTLLSANRTEGC